MSVHFYVNDMTFCILAAAKNGRKRRYSISSTFFILNLFNLEGEGLTKSLVMTTSLSSDQKSNYIECYVDFLEQ